ncbi:DNA protecting protein DprA [Bombiscardovia apis]|uniref:DNA protecting protein DprA n=1 Tax=Bombiscardovia apis TaxID=2932182 RepID=A0ABM8BC04_9BIFI|nr:DNA-processing protein DprA [Bombiscardovia apis]BDR54422.1 DNA protecting protein DprA [Bombiscardovia apis]
MTLSSTPFAPYPQPSAEALSRATLTYCIDSPDAILYATLLGAPSAAELVSSIEALPAQLPAKSSPPSASIARNLNRLDGMFITGSARWGRRASERDLTKFRQSLGKWRARLATLPTHERSELARWLTQDGCYWIIAPGEGSWPRQLGDLALRSDWAPPLCLWGRGSAQALVSCEEPVAVVGSRYCNDYGRFVAHQVGLQAAASGHLVVSGGALGADASAHWGALAAKREGAPPPGRTVAVFAGGLNHRGPRSNLKLFEAIERQEGALISELCPDTIPEARRFLLRNRIIAGLAQVVVVAQARHRSGALNTATWAAELGREVYAAPGSIDNPENTGCNHLIHDGKAMILISATDVSEICHQSHEPSVENHSQRQPSYHNDSAVSQPPQAPLSSATRSTTKRQAPSKVSTTHKPSSNTPPLSDQQQSVLTAVEACKKQGVEPTSEHINALLNSSGEQACSMQEVMQTLGGMELQGLLEIVNGVVQLPKSASTRAQHRR